MTEELKYYALQATSAKHAKALARKSRRHFGEGHKIKNANWVIVGPTTRAPWAWREALPSGGDWNMYAGYSPENAAENAGV